MVIRQRAVQPLDKEERHRAILDAAGRLLQRAPDRVPSVAEVADEAGLAKGTVYLYFPSKEELLLALHERNLDRYFGALDARLEGAGPVTLDDLIADIAEHVVRPPLFLPLAGRCFALMAQSVPAAAAEAFRQRIALRIERAGAGLERHFAGLAPGEGVAKLRHSFALIIGLWQMSTASGCAPPPAGTAGATSSGRSWDYATELAAALRALWRAAADRSSRPAA
jgi:AcrR family transcriptional regulator